MCTVLYSEGSALQRQNTEIFPDEEYRGLRPNIYIHASVSDLYIPMIGLPILLEEICRPILGLYKSLTDTWMLKLRLRPRYSQKRNAYMGFSLQCVLNKNNFGIRKGADLQPPRRQGWGLSRPQDPASPTPGTSLTLFTYWVQYIYCAMPSLSCTACSDTVGLRVGSTLNPNFFKIS